MGSLPERGQLEKGPEGHNSFLCLYSLGTSMPPIIIAPEHLAVIDTFIFKLPQGIG